MIRHGGMVSFMIYMPLVCVVACCGVQAVFLQVAPFKFDLAPPSISRKLVFRKENCTECLLVCRKDKLVVKGNSTFRFILPLRG